MQAANEDSSVAGGAGTLGFACCKALLEQYVIFLIVMSNRLRGKRAERSRKTQHCVLYASHPQLIRDSLSLLKQASIIVLTVDKWRERIDDLRRKSNTVKS
jgi:NAD(P)-dependent dehydrogenase (short-subunit alcohol dehydrogenase family)